MTAARISAEELERRLRAVQVLISAPAQRADDRCEFRENLECARIAVGYLIRDLEWGGLAA
jgi:hypothetical protein